MSTSLLDLVKNTIVLKCSLPCNDRKIGKSAISTRDDNCYISTNETDIAKIIYNNIINYSFDAFEMKFDSEILLKKALYSRIRYNNAATDETKLSFGFYGEVLLHSILHVIYKAPPLISKGHFYIVGNGESKGYDSYHLVESDDQLHLWFGEVKFREQSSSCIKSALSELSNKVLTDNYFTENNLIPIFDEMSKNDKYNPVIANSKLQSIKIKWIEKGEITIDDFKKENIGIVYPIFIIFNQSTLGYDKSLENCIEYIKKNYSDLKFDDMSLETTIFFIFLPVDSVKEIKKTVIKWIESKEQLMS